MKIRAPKVQNHSKVKRNRKMRKINIFEKFLKMKVCNRIKGKIKKTVKKTLILNKIRNGAKHSPSALRQ